MDIVLEIMDTFVLDKVYATLLPAKGPITMPKNLTLNGVSSLVESHVYGVDPPQFFLPTELAYSSLLCRSNVLRQTISFFIITTIFGILLYLSTAYLNYRFVYDHENFKHPRYLKNQVQLEIKQSVSAIPIMTLLTVPWFVAECQGYSRLFMNPNDHGIWYMFFQFPLFIMFTDCLIYLIHRWLHNPAVYKHLHKPHHKWLVPTPFASHAFHPVDGYMQSLPYHIFPFIFPLHKVAYVVLFAFVNIWTVLIHDGEYLSHDPIINGSACHTIHHLYFNYNYGQYTTLWDRLGGTHREPDRELFDGKLKKSKSTWDKQINNLEEIRKQVEGDDDRVYTSGSAKQ